MTKFKFSVGPWNVHSGVDSYGPATRNEIEFEEKIRKFAELGFSAIQFHDDDAVPNINDYTEEEIKEVMDGYDPSDKDNQSNLERMMQERAFSHLTE